MEKNMTVGDIIHPLFEIDSDIIRLSQKDWFIIKKADVDGIVLNDAIDSDCEMSMTSDYLTDNFEPVQISCDLGDEQIFLCQMIADKVVEYAKRVKMDDEKFFDKIDGFISVIEGNVDLNTLHNCLCQKMDKEIADEIIMNRKMERGNQGSNDVPMVAGPAIEQVVDTMVQPIAEIIDTNPTVLAEAFVQGRHEAVKASIGDNINLYNGVLDVIADNSKDMFKLAMATIIKKDAAIKTAKIDEYTTIDIIDQNHLLVKIAYEGLMKVGLDKFIGGRSYQDKGQFRVVDYQPFERHIATIVKQTYPNCWIKLFGVANLTQDFEIQMPVSVSNMNDGDSFTKTDYRNIWASKKVAVKPEKMEVFPEKLDFQTKPINEFVEEFTTEDAHIQFLMDVLENMKEELREKSGERMIEDLEKSGIAKDGTQHMDKSTKIMNKVINDIITKIGMYKKKVKGVTQQYIYNKLETHSKNDYKGYKPDPQKLLDVVMSTNAAIKTQVDELNKKYAEEWAKVEDKITSSKSLTVKTKAYEPDETNKQSSLKTADDIWQKLKNVWFSIVNGINYLVSFMFHKKTEINKTIDEGMMQLDEVTAEASNG